MTNSEIPADEPAMSEDEQEAQSIRYVDALRVVLLSSGRWAIWPIWLDHELFIMDKLDEDKLKLMYEKQHQIEKVRKERIELESSSKPGVSLSLEELGLI